MYSDVFCKVYDAFGWNYYPEEFGAQLLQWLKQQGLQPETAMDLACGTGVLCRILHDHGIRAAGMDLSQGMIDIARANSPDIAYTVADMVGFQPEERYDLVTCTGDALNHLSDGADVAQVLKNVYGYLQPGGWFVFDLLNEREISTSEPFEMDFSESVRVWFQMTQPTQRSVNLKIRVYEKGTLAFEENIRETVHDPAVVCKVLEDCGFRVHRCADRLLDDGGHGTTWFIAAQKSFA